MNTSNPDATGPRIRAYLASVKPDEGELMQGLQDAAARGRSQIEHLAIASDTGADLTWDAGQCADVLTWMQHHKPIQPATWWTEEARVSHICGYEAVLDTLATSLRYPTEPADSDDLDRLLKYSGSIQASPVDEALDEQRYLVQQAKGIISCASEYICHGTETETPQLALAATLKMLDGIYDALDAGNLEDRALAIARAKGGES